MLILYLPSLIGGCAVYDYGCRLDGVVEKAVLKEDPNACKTFNGFVEERCYHLYSVQTMDYSACDNLAHPGQCRIEVAIAAEDVELCILIESKTQREICLEGVAEAKGDIEICNLIVPSGNLIDYRQACYQKVAYATLNPEICVDLLDSNVYCIRGVATRAKNLSICEDYLDHQPSIDDCKYYIERGDVPSF